MNLYQVQDSDRPMFVVAQTWSQALEKWRKVIREENDLPEDDPVDPHGIQFVADSYELILGQEGEATPESEKGILLVNVGSETRPAASDQSGPKGCRGSDEYTRPLC